MTIGTLTYKTKGGPDAGYSVDFDALPEGSQRALINYGFSHYLGNQQAARATAEAEKAKDEGRAFGDAERNAWLHDRRTEALAALTAGTVGTRVRSTVKDLDYYIMEFATSAVQERFKTANAKRAAAGQPLAKWPSGKGSADRVRALVEAWLAKGNNKAEATKMAKRKMDELAKAATRGDDNDDDIFNDLAAE